MVIGELERELKSVVGRSLVGITLREGIRCERLADGRSLRFRPKTGGYYRDSMMPLEEIAAHVIRSGVRPVVAAWCERHGSLRMSYDFTSVTVTIVPSENDDFRAVIVMANGFVAQRTLKQGLEPLQAMVGGGIELVELGKDAQMFVNADGFRLGLSVNQVATDLVINDSPYDYLIDYGIKGDVVICGVDEDGDCGDAPAWVYRRLRVKR